MIERENNLKEKEFNSKYVINHVHVACKYITVEAKEEEEETANFASYSAALYISALVNAYVIIQLLACDCELKNSNEGSPEFRTPLIFDKRLKLKLDFQVHTTGIGSSPR